MSKGSTKRGERTLTDVARALDQVRELVGRRLDDMDLEAVRRRGTRLAGTARAEIERRVRPRPRRWTPPAGGLGLAGLVLAGVALAGVGWLLRDRERRESARRRLGSAQAGVRERYADLTGGRSPSQASLEERVREAIARDGGVPAGLEVVVEGRTVYLRGSVGDAALADAAAERAHGVDGVAAVVNLTAGSAEASRTR